MTKRTYFPIGVKLSLIMCLLVGVALLITLFLDLRASRAAINGFANDRLLVLAQMRVDRIERWSQEKAKRMAQAALDPSVVLALRAFRNAWQGEEDQETLRNVVFDTKLEDPATDLQADYVLMHNRYHSVFDAMVADGSIADVHLILPDGQYIYSHSKTLLLGDVVTEVGPPSVAEAWEKVVKTSSAVPEFVPLEGQASGPTSAVAIYNQSNALLGVLVVEFSSQAILAVLSDLKEVGMSAQTTLTLAEVKVLSAGNVTDEIVRNVALPVTVAGQTYTLNLSQAAAEVEQAVNDILWKSLMQWAIVLLVAAAISIPTARAISTPLSDVRRAMVRISDRRFDVSVPHTKRSDEIGDIARTLSAFRSSLQMGQRATRDATFKGAAFEASSAALIVIRLDFTILTVNAAFRALLTSHTEAFSKLSSSPDPERLMGMSLDALQTEEGAIQEILDAAAELPYSADIRVGETSFRLTFNLIDGADGERIGYVVEWEDVTERRVIAATLDAIEANQATAEFDRNGLLIKANQNFCASVECTPGDHLDDLLYSATQGEGLVDGLSEERVLAGAFSGMAPSGHATTLQGGFSFAGSATTGTHRILFLGHDVTDVQADLAKAEALRAEMVAAQSAVMDRLRGALRNLADGDLIGQIETAFPPEYEQLRRDFNQSVDALRETLGVVVDNACSIKIEASEISNATDKLAERAEQQSATLEETAASVSLITSAVQVAAGGAQRANIVVSAALDHATTSDRIVGEAVNAMGAIEASSGQIARIVSVIDDIAFQTNLLALNAGVEAARAGPAGRGFAIVASEVRALAQRSADAANEIRDLIETSETQVRKGARLVGKAGEVLQSIAASIADIATHVDNIAASSKEQSAGLSNVDMSMGQLDQANQRNGTMFKETTAAARAMVRESMSLTHAVAQFRVDDDLRKKRSA